MLVNIICYKQSCLLVSAFDDAIFEARTGDLRFRGLSGIAIFAEMSVYVHNYAQQTVLHVCFSSPEHKFRVSYKDHEMSGVSRPSTFYLVHSLQITFDIQSF